jgi:hypothetical protein
VSIQRSLAGGAAVALGIAVALGATVDVGPAPTSAALAHAHAEDSTATGNSDLRNDMRKLWEDHITWTRMYIVSAVADLPDTRTAADRLLRNQDDIGDAIKPFYGARAGERLSKLLREHILVAAELVEAAKQGESQAVDEANARWHANADAIARFLSTANPDNWPRAEMKAMMRDHLGLTLEEATARLQGRWEADVAAYDRIHRQILHMADMLSAGIIRQFPERF